MLREHSSHSRWSSIWIDLGGFITYIKQFGDSLFSEKWAARLVSKLRSAMNNSLYVGSDNDGGC